MDIARLMLAARSAPRANLAVRERGGPFRAIRAALPAIIELRAEGLTYAQIAVGLTAEGVLRADGQPMTGGYLGNVVRLLETRDRRRRARLVQRLDLPTRTESSVQLNPALKAKSTIKLSPELAETRQPSVDMAAIEELGRAEERRLRAEGKAFLEAVLKKE